jgi:hypothetical protein
VEPHQVSISLKRVQSFIFEVPRLKAMLGANALIGHMMRHELRELARGKALACSWPASMPLASLADPLSESRDPDNPAGLFAEGILARDGGHFIAVFEDRKAAEDFQRGAEEIVAANLPGVLFDVAVKPFGLDEKERRDLAPPMEVHLLDLPVLQVCQETGTGIASDSGQKSDWVSRSVTRRMAWGDKFYEGNTRDVVGLLRQHGLYPDAQMNWKSPADLGDLTSGDYLALVHADGNRIGLRYNEWKKKAPADPVAKEAHGQAFYHSMRVAVRRALMAAIEQTFTYPNGFRPYEILMLGGDDLLLACRTNMALEFARRYGCALECHLLADGKPADAAIGVAVAKCTYPLHRLQELAESLAASAKRLYRALPENEKCSVVDWQVITQSWFADVAGARQESERLRYIINGSEETLLFTARPYKVRGDGPSLSLDGLMRQVALLSARSTGQRLARSPLRGLRDACRQGRRAGEAAFNNLPRHVQEALGRKLWQGLDGGVHLTQALDAVGILEIARLGRKDNDRTAVLPS